MRLQITKRQAEILSDLLDNQVEYLEDFEEQDTDEMQQLKECRILAEMLYTATLSVDDNRHIQATSEDHAPTS
jgi:hypothetical protein